MGPLCYIEYCGIRNRTIRGFYCIITVTSHRYRCISDYQQLICWFKSLFILTTKKTSKLHIKGPLWGESISHQWIPWGESMGMRGFPSQKRSNAGHWFNIKITSYQYKKSHCGDKTILRPSYLHNGISYTGKTTSLYWIRAQKVFPCHDLMVMYLFAVLRFTEKKGSFCGQPWRSWH